MNTHGSSRFSRWLLITAVAAAIGLFGCDSATRITGRVVLPGVADASGVVVNAYMGKRASDDFSHGTSTTTDKAGAYAIEFSGVGGKFFVTAYAMSTIENVMATSIDVGEGGSGVVPDLVFTPVGTVSGRVMLEGASSDANAGSTVAVDGSDLMASTDHDGSFLLTQVRIGGHQLEAKHDGYEPATVQILPVVYDEDTRIEDLVLQALSVPTTGPGP